MIIQQSFYFIYFIFHNFPALINGQAIDVIQSCPKSQYLSSTDLICISCNENTTQSPNGFSCVCNPGYIYTRNGGGNAVFCKKCDQGFVTSSDGWSCVPCANADPSQTICQKTCSNLQILYKSELSGFQINGSCINCSSKYSPINNQCQLCLNALNTNNLISDCVCESTLTNTGTACWNKNINNGNKSDLTYNSITISSGYLMEHMMDSVALCQKSVDSGCQSLANMCVLDSYNINEYMDNRGGGKLGPCGMFGIIDYSKGSPYTKKSGFPWLYYPISDPISNLLKEINHGYSKGEFLQVILAAYDLSGQFLGFRNATKDGTLQLCPNSILQRSETYRFGTYYLEQCSINVNQLFNQSIYTPIFYDPYISYTESRGNSVKLYPIPVIINQLGNPQPSLRTRRFILVDNVGSISSPYTSNKTASYVRYISSMRIVVTKKFTNFDVQRDGQILLPYIEANMSIVSSASAITTTDISFEVFYRNEDSYTNSVQYSISVAMGVLCALSGLYAILRCFLWCRRSGISGFEGLVLLKLLAHGAASISNVFFLVIFGVSLYFLLLYKNQTLFSIVPPNDDTFFIAYLISAFLLKLLEIVHIFVTQCTIDIFLIDWERPKHLLAPKQVIEKSKFEHNEANGDQIADNREKIASKTGVSIWRSYFIANEWNEIQTYRKTSLIFNLIIVLLFMDVIGFANITRLDSFVNYNPLPGSYQAPFYRMFRFSVIVSIFGITAFIQWLFSILIYERLIEDKLRNYVDLCSVSNISVFILAHRQFGYYIHGRSVHGSADISLAEMYIALQKENSGSCAKRGLESDSMQQTYIMALPYSFRDGLDAVYQPTGTRLREDTRTLQYLEVNKFLDKFINRTNNPRITFRFQDRKFFEDIFDGEFEDNSYEGRFYRDNGTSFGNVLFYGQELSLITFDILLFCVVDLILQNTVFDAFITWGLVTVLKIIRNGCGAQNLAKKTLVDRRFLI